MTASNNVECSECGKMSVREIPEPYHFMYGTDNLVQLTASLIVMTCEECGFRFTDGRANNLEHDTICQVIGPAHVSGNP
jgi:hypothetical protein